MTRDEYNVLFHRLELNLVAFKRLMDCDEEVLSLVNHAIKAEREACYTIAKFNQSNHLEHLTADQIKARGETK
jgi:hypothetical protein